MHARIDISEVELHTKIRAKYLRAIENEEWDLLPGPVYVRSFLKTYGDYLGLDSRLLVDEFKRRYERPDHDPRAMTNLSRERETRGGSRAGNRGAGRGGNRGAGRGAGRASPARQSGGGGALASLLFSPRALIGVVLIAVVVALYLIGSGGGNKTPSGGTGQRTTPVTHHKHHNPPRKHAQTTPTHTVTTPKKPPVPTNATLALVPTGTVYVCVENASGKALIPGQIFSQGEKVPSETAKGLLVTLGNASVQVTANGKPYPVTASTSAIAFRVTPTAVKPLTAGPTCQ